MGSKESNNTEAREQTEIALYPEERAATNTPLAQPETLNLQPFDMADVVKTTSPGSDCTSQTSDTSHTYDQNRSGTQQIPLRDSTSFQQILRSALKNKETHTKVHDADMALLGLLDEMESLQRKVSVSVKQVYVP